MHDPTWTDIADYNTFVTGVASGVPSLAALGTTWSVIGSTAAIDARDNTLTNPTAATGVPIYDLADDRIADDNADLWDGAIQAPIQFDETGAALAVVVHTGTDATGVEAAGSALGMSSIAAGYSAATGSLWVTGAGGDNPFFETSFYAISGVLTVVPEPGTLSLATMGTIALVGEGLRRRRQRSRRK